ncbi:hypothetical protein [Ferrovibrio sp.]|uniref:hypothetical protein n=1 Tax=Ferrovibrio sp. TaxID=1917215 RepID=UPI0025C58708|nr:hypothetical protein [Ferrovibrio sp.]MBX3455799.1 hypothetical protein [Ferrovibrio sp.]
MSQPDWRSQVMAMVKADAKGIAGVAKRLGLTRPQLSGLLHDTYRASPAAKQSLVARIEIALREGHVLCPFLNRELAERECLAFQDRPQPSGIASELRHYIACESCLTGKLLRPAAPRTTRKSKPTTNSMEASDARTA